MTLSGRNSFFKAGILVSAAALIAIGIFSFKTLPFYSDVVGRAARRAPGIIQGLAGHFIGPAPYVSFVTMAAAVMYALITLILIYYFFEKTQAVEILFFALFVFSFALEGARIIVPMGTAYNFPNLYLVLASRALFFARYFGILSLFAASLYAAGLEIQKQGYIILIAMAAALVFAFEIPIDGQSWDSSLNMISGYPVMFKLVEAGIVLITMTSFFIAAYSRGSREYIFIGVGSLLVCTGRNMLLCADTWITPLPALAMLALGAWFICAQTRRIYLWL